MQNQVQAVQIDDAAAGAAGGAASISVVQRLYDGVDRYVEDEATGTAAPHLYFCQLGSLNKQQFCASVSVV